MSADHLEGAACADVCRRVYDLQAEALRPLLERRAFLSQGALALLATVVAACGVGADFLTAPASVSLSVRVADYSSLASVGGVAYVTSGGSPLAIVRTSASDFVVLSRICTHQGGVVNSVSGGFECPRHGARFNASGTWIGGERTTSLHTYPAAWDEASGTLTIG